MDIENTTVFDAKKSWQKVLLWKGAEMIFITAAGEYRVMLRKFDRVFKIQGLQFISCRRTSQVSKMFVFFYSLVLKDRKISSYLLSTLG